ncbi:MAG: hypothetical protein AABN34_28620 [Acidobacteriota bacterium]
MEDIGPDFDEDIGVEGLLLGKHSSEGPSSFESRSDGEISNVTAPEGQASNQ